MSLIVGSYQRLMREFFLSVLCCGAVLTIVKTDHVRTWDVLRSKNGNALLATNGGAGSWSKNGGTWQQSIQCFTARGPLPPFVCCCVNHNQMYVVCRHDVCREKRHFYNFTSFSGECILWHFGTQNAAPTGFCVVSHSTIRQKPDLCSPFKELMGHWVSPLPFFFTVTASLTTYNEMWKLWAALSLFVTAEYLRHDSQNDLTPRQCVRQNTHKFVFTKQNVCKCCMS